MDKVRFQAIFQNTLDGIITINRDGIIDAVNPAAARMFGYEISELQGKKINILMPAPHRENHDNYIESFLRTGVRKVIGFGRELTGVCKDGSLFPFVLSVTEIKVDEGHLFLGVIHDLTQLRRTESALWESEKRISSIFRTAVDCIINIDMRGKIEMVNPAGARMFGYEEHELIGQNVRLLMPEPYHSEHDGYMSRYLQTGEAKIIGIGREVTAKRKDGTIFPIYLSVSMAEQEGRVIFTGIIHDITRQKEYEEELVRTAKELEKSRQLLERRVMERTEELEKVVMDLERANMGLKITQEELEKSLDREKELSDLKSKFVTLASHEFRTPLATILSSAALIGRYQRPEDAPNRDRHVARIKNTVGALNSILNEFLSYSKIEEGKVILSPITFQLSEFCEEVREEMSTVTKPGQEIICHFAEGIDAEVTQDRQILKNIVINLLSNAIKYSPEGKTINCKCSTSGDHLVISVEDEGIGIPLEDQPHLFERFYRAHNATHIQGTGLGLNIVRRYSEFLGGSVKFASEPGKGSIFTISIPYSKPQ